MYFANVAEDAVGIGLNLHIEMHHLHSEPKVRIQLFILYHCAHYCQVGYEVSKNE